jgi:hypothetical protein
LEQQQRMQEVLHPGQVVHAKRSQNHMFWDVAARTIKSAEVCLFLMLAQSINCIHAEQHSAACTWHVVTDVALLLSSSRTMQPTLADNGSRQRHHVDALAFNSCDAWLNSRVHDACRCRGSRRASQMQL